jgi:long-chain fatty acid transport protein
MAELYSFRGRPDQAGDAVHAARWAALRRGALGVLALAFPPFTQAHATDGYFSEGYSIINQGMGGASIAYPRDTLAIATNPAGLFSVGNRVDLGIEYFDPDRGASIVGNAFGPNQDFSANGLSNFLALMASVVGIGYCGRQ